MPTKLTAESAKIAEKAGAFLSNHPCILQLLNLIPSVTQLH